MAHAKSVQTEVSLYLQFRLRDLLASGKLDANTIAEKAGVTKGQISQLKNHAVGVGWKTLKGMGEVLGMSVDEIEAASSKWAKQHGDLLKTAIEEPKVELPERYPNRLLAAEVARRSGISEQAINSVMSWSLKSRQDPNPLEWLEDIRSEERRMRRDVNAERAASQAEALRERTRGHLPKRRR
jgi:transcriptional regulator with XRE-family HTH domain